MNYIVLYHICPNRSTLKIFNIKACHPAPTAVVYMHIYGNRNHMDLRFQGSTDLRMGGSQTDQNVS